MSTAVEERLTDYRATLEAAIEAHRRGLQHRADRNWWLLAPLAGALAAVTIAAVVIVGGVGDNTAPSPAAVAPTAPAVLPAPATEASLAGSVPVPSPPAAPLPPATAMPGQTETVIDTTAAGETTVAPAPPPLVEAFGDSVMLGAADELTTRGIAVDANVSQQMQNLVPTVQQMRDLGRLSDTVVIHLGVNGELADQTITDFFDALADVPNVKVLTIAADRPWIPANNAKLQALPARYPNVELLYWDGLAPACPGDCFYDDGVHLRQAGQDYYSNLIFSLLGLDSDAAGPLDSTAVANG